MKKPLHIIAVATFGVAVGSLLTSLFAQSGRSSDWRSLERAYAEANLELAEARLAMANAQRQQVADSVSVDALAALQSGVDLARSRVNQLKGNSNNTFMTAAIAAAEQDLKAAQSVYERSLEANKLSAGAVSDLELNQEAAEVDVAKARLAAVRALGQQPIEVRVQWQLTQLQDQIRALWARPLIED